MQPREFNGQRAQRHWLDLARNLGSYPFSLPSHSQSPTGILSPKQSKGQGPPSSLCPLSHPHLAPWFCLFNQSVLPIFCFTPCIRLSHPPERSSMSPAVYSLWLAPMKWHERLHPICFSVSSYAGNTNNLNYSVHISSNSLAFRLLLVTNPHPCTHNWMTNKTYHFEAQGSSQRILYRLSLHSSRDSNALPEFLYILSVYYCFPSHSISDILLIFKSPTSNLVLGI